MHNDEVKLIIFQPTVNVITMRLITNSTINPNQMQTAGENTNIRLGLTWLGIKLGWCEK